MVTWRPSSGFIRELGVDRLISSTPSRERDLIVAQVTARILFPSSKLATSRLLSSCTLAQELGLGDETDVDELYDALDWLLERQGRIEKKLGRRHLGSSSRALYDLSSGFYDGRHCPLAALGHNRDGKRDTLIIEYGLLTDGQGRPVAISVYRGNRSDSTTVPDQVAKLQEEFGLKEVVLVGDRGLLTRTQLQTLREYPGLGWISALKSREIRTLIDKGPLQLSLLDERGLAEIASPDFPGERLVACFNPLLAEERRRTRRELLEETDLQIRPIRHRTENHVRAHVFLCMPAYYVDWHLRRALAPPPFRGRGARRGSLDTPPRRQGRTVTPDSHQEVSTSHPRRSARHGSADAARRAGFPVAEHLPHEGGRPDPSCDLHPDHGTHALTGSRL
jgi:hypothetical protein